MPPKRPRIKNSKKSKMREQVTGIDALLPEEPVEVVAAPEPPPRVEEVLEPISDALPSLEEVGIDYNQAEICPYEPHRIVTLVMGGKEYAVPRHLVPLHPRWGVTYSSGLKPVIDLGDIRVDTGHTVVHFLYTGKYETLRPILDAKGRRTRPCLGVEYEKSVLVYRAARVYGLEGLEALARGYIQKFSSSLSIFQILDAARMVFAKLPKDEEWFHEYLYEQLLAAFEVNETTFEQDEFYDAIGEDVVFLKQVVRTMTRIFSKVRIDHIVAQHFSEMRAAAAQAGHSDWGEQPPVPQEETVHKVRTIHFPGTSEGPSSNQTVAGDSPPPSPPVDVVSWDDPGLESPVSLDVYSENGTPMYEEEEPILGGEEKAQEHSGYGISIESIGSSGWRPIWKQPRTGKLL